MSQISICPLRKTWLSNWWKTPCWQSQRSDVSCSWPSGLHTSQGGFCPTHLYRSSPSPRFLGWLWRLEPSTPSTDFLWDDWLGHSRTLMCFFLSHSFVALAMCFGSLSCWNTHPRTICNSLAGFNVLALMVHGPIHRSVDAAQLSCPLSRKTAPKAQCFHLHVWRWQHPNSSSSKHSELCWCKRASF